jgi:Polysaccharide deacetylase
MSPAISNIHCPVLTYHSANISGNTYESNDHIAFYQDIRLIHALGFRVINLEMLVDRLLSGEETPRDVVALTMDDATNFDYYDLSHPTWGMQRSMLNIMKDFIDEFGRAAQPDLHATSFVIASPAARAELDRKCLVDRGWYTDEWWSEAIASGLVGIGNHSWDHNHPNVSRVAQRRQEKGTFRNIDTYVDADAQIRRAGDFLESKTAGRASRLFAYPFGESNEYLVDSYLPRYASEHHVKAAFTTRSSVESVPSIPWAIPRWVCRDDWRSPDALAAILTAVRAER